MKKLLLLILVWSLGYSPMSANSSDITNQNFSISECLNITDLNSTICPETNVSFIMNSTNLTVVVIMNTTFVNNLTIMNTTYNLTTNNTIYLNNITNVTPVSQPIIQQCPTYERIERALTPGDSAESIDRNFKFTCQNDESIEFPEVPSYMQNCTNPIMQWRCPARMFEVGCSVEQSFSDDVPGCFSTFSSAYITKEQNTNQTVLYLNQQISELTNNLNKTATDLDEERLKRSNDLVLPLLLIAVLMGGILFNMKDLKFPQLEMPQLPFGKPKIEQQTDKELDEFFKGDK